MARVLVTGATGFIGGGLVRALKARGDTVRALVREARAERAGSLGAVELHEGDLIVPESLRGIERDVDLVLHCASMLGKWGTPESALFDVNVTGTVNLVSCFAGVPLERFIHLSAGGVTGPVRGDPADENYVCHPATPYERTKYDAERRALELASTHGIPLAVVRPTFTYGPLDPHKLPLFRAIQRGRYAFLDDGMSVNHPGYIDDVIDGILLAAGRAAAGEVYIVGGTAPVTKRELAFTIADLLGVRRPTLRIPRWFAWPAAGTAEWAGRLLRFEPLLTRSRVMMMADNFGYRIDKARRELGYEPRVDLSEGLSRTVDSYRSRGLL